MPITQFPLKEEYNYVKFTFHSDRYVFWLFFPCLLPEWKIGKRDCNTKNQKKKKNFSDGTRLFALMQAFEYVKISI